jgi:hypothetical protein
LRWLARANTETIVSTSYHKMVFCFKRPLSELYAFGIWSKSQFILQSNTRRLLHIFCTTEETTRSQTGCTPDYPERYRLSAAGTNRHFYGFVEGREKDYCINMDGWDRLPIQFNWKLYRETNSALIYLAKRTSWISRVSGKSCYHEISTLSNKILEAPGG